MIWELLQLEERHDRFQNKRPHLIFSSFKRKKSNVQPPTVKLLRKGCHFFWGQISLVYSDIKAKIW